MFRRLSIAASLVVCLGLGATPALAGDDASEESSENKESSSSDKKDSEESPKTKDIRRLLEITGTPKLGLRIAKRIIKSMKRSHPDVPEKFWDEFENEMSKDAFISIIVPIYEKHFTHDDIKKLIEFYKTDVGKKYVEKLPKLTMESMQAGRQWGRKLGQRIVDKLRAKGYQ